MSRVANDDLLNLSLVWQRQLMIAIFYKLFPMPFPNELYLMGIQPTVCREHMRWANICPDVLAKWTPHKIGLRVGTIQVGCEMCRTDRLTD